LRKANLSIPDWEIVINDHLLQHSIMQNPGHVEAIGIHGNLGKNILDSIFLLSERGQSTQQIAIPERSLKNVTRLYLIVSEDCIRGDISNALPSERFQQILVEVAKGLLIGWKIGIGIHVLSASILRDQLFIVGFFDLSGVGTASDGENV
jgi:hypothetical protein